MPQPQSLAPPSWNPFNSPIPNPITNDLQGTDPAAAGARHILARQAIGATVRAGALAVSASKAIMTEPKTISSLSEALQQTPEIPKMPDNLLTPHTDDLSLEFDGSQIEAQAIKQMSSKAVAKASTRNTVEGSQAAYTYLRNKAAARAASEEGMAKMLGRAVASGAEALGGTAVKQGAEIAGRASLAELGMGASAAYDVGSTMWHGYQAYRAASDNKSREGFDQKYYGTPEVAAETRRIRAMDPSYPQSDWQDTKDTTGSAAPDMGLLGQTLLAGATGGGQ